MNMGIPRRTQLEEWPQEISILPRASVILLLILITTDQIWRHSRNILNGYIDSVIALDWIVEIGVVGLITIIVCIGVRLTVNLSIKKIIGLPISDIKDLLKWVYVAIAASSYNYILETPSGFGPQYISELWFLFIRLLRSSILVPVYEELVYRFTIYGIIRTRLGWWPAALGSAAIFFFVHIDSINYTWLIYLQLFLFYFSFGLLTAYLYETRRVLLPCIVVHSIVNFTYFTAPLIGYLLFGTIATTDPPVLQ